MPPKQRTTRPRATQSAPKARTRRPQAATEAPPATEQEAPAAVTPDAVSILPVEEPSALDITEVHYTAEEGPQEVYLSPPLQEMTVAWPIIQRMLAWWQDRERALQEPTEPLERVTYHVSPRWIAAVRREADQTGESYAAVVNRAFALYFTRET